MAPITTITDISSITFNGYDYTNPIDLNNNNVLNVNKCIFQENTKNIKLEFGRPVKLSNVKLYKAGYTTEIPFKLWHNIQGNFDIYQEFNPDDQSYTTADISNLAVNNIIIKLDKSVPTPNIFQYQPTITDNFFYIYSKNITHLKWARASSTNYIRYTPNIDICSNGLSIKDFGDKLKERLQIFQKEIIDSFDIVSGESHKYKLVLKNNSNYDIVIYTNSNLFTYFGIVFNDVSGNYFDISSNATKTIEFNYKPYLPFILDVTYNNDLSSNTYGDYNKRGNSIFDINDILPATDASGDDITHNNTTIRLPITSNHLIKYNNTTLIKEDTTSDLSYSKIYTYFYDLSSNHNVIDFLTVNNDLSFSDLSSNLFDISNNLNANTIDTSNIYVIDVSANYGIFKSDISINTLSTNNMINDKTNLETGHISLNNIPNFNLSTNKYNSIKFEFDNSTPLIFYNFKFFDSNNNNPSFYVYDSSVSKIYDNSMTSFTYTFNTTDISSIIFDFVNPVEYGLSFSFDKNDITFEINNTNNKIHYKANNSDSSYNNRVIEAVITPTIYDLSNINTLLSEIISSANYNIKTSDNGLFKINNGINEFTTDISYSFKDLSLNNILESDISINIISSIFDLCMNIPLIIYDQYNPFQYNKPKLLLLFDKNKTKTTSESDVFQTDLSYSIYYDLSNSFFSSFFESDISYITPSDISDGAVYFNSYVLSQIINVKDSSWNSADDISFIDISFDRFAALLTLKDNTCEATKFSIHYKNDLSDNWIDLSYQNYYKHRYFLYETAEEISYNNYNQPTYFSIPFSESIINIDNSSNPILEYSLSNIGPTNYKFNIDNSKNIIDICNQLVIEKDLSCVDICYNTLNYKTINHNINNIDVSNSAILGKIKVINSDNNISFETVDISTTRLAYYHSGTSYDISYAKPRMEIVSDISDISGWRIKLINEPTAHCEEISFEIDKSNKTVFTVHSGVLLSYGYDLITSDKNIKYNITDISCANYIIQNMLPCSYHKSPTITDLSNSVYDTGYIAQDLLKMDELNHTVNKNPDDLYSVNYDSIIPFLCKTVQELHSEVSYLENLIATIENKKHD